MGDCEICGAVKVATRQTTMARAPVEACVRCIERMGLDAPEAPAPRPTTTPSARTAPTRTRTRTSGGYGGIGHKGKDIMMRREKALRDDFANTVRDGRVAKGWDQRELAKRMAERVNIVQHTEGGKRPSDGVIKKFERILNIKLLIEREAEEERDVNKTSDRSMTMADFYERAKKDL
jgi:uncharacterized protein (TIGR00270 family)